MWVVLRSQVEEVSMVGGSKEGQVVDASADGPVSGLATGWIDL